MQPFGCKIDETARLFKFFHDRYKPGTRNLPNFAQGTMINLWVIRSKALLMLAVFAANFYTVCHCTPAAPPHRHTCCERPSREETANPKNNIPCKDGCSHTHSIKFNLLEKQISSPIGIYPPFTAVLPASFLPARSPLTVAALPPTILKELRRRSIPPDRLAMYQYFLI